MELELVFVNPDAPPSEKELKKELGDSYAAFDRLAKSIETVKPAWKYYNKKSGWVYRAEGKKRVAFYVTPLSGQFHFGMALSGTDRDGLLGDTKTPKSIVKALQDAEKVMEGYPFTIMVKKAAGIEPILKVLRMLGRL